MSGTPNFGIYNMVVPSSGPKVVESRFDFRTSNTDEIDLTNMMQNGTMDFVQGGYFDNLDNPHGVFVQVGITGHRIYVPPKSGLFTPLLSPVPSIINGRVAGANGFVAVFLYNVPIPPFLVTSAE